MNEEKVGGDTDIELTRAIVTAGNILGINPSLEIARKQLVKYPPGDLRRLGHHLPVLFAKGLPQQPTSSFRIALPFLMIRNIVFDWFSEFDRPVASRQ